MRCSCPKCNANITPEIHDIPDEGGVTKCPDCGANFLLRKESFARRALHKGSDISCANCGSELGPSIYCPGCNTLYPDYLVAETFSASKRQLDKLLAGFKGLFPARKAVVAKYEPGVAAAEPKKGVKLPGQPLQIAIIIVAFIAAAVGGGIYYFKEKAETDFTDNYFKTLYGVKTSADYGLNVCNKVVAEWTAQGLSPKLAPNELLFLKRGKEDVDRDIKRIVKVPEKFKTSHADLLALNEIHLKINATASTPAGTADTFAASVAKLDEEFRKSAGKLKSSLPPRLATGLEERKTNYKELAKL
jgi:hypothetical protein